MSLLPGVPPGGHRGADGLRAGEGLRVQPEDPGGRGGGQHLCLPERRQDDAAPGEALPSYLGDEMNRSDLAELPFTRSVLSQVNQISLLQILLVLSCYLGFRMFAKYVLCLYAHFDSQI